MHEGGGRWVGSNKVVELKKKKKELASIVRPRNHIIWLIVKADKKTCLVMFIFSNEKDHYCSVL